MSTAATTAKSTTTPPSDLGDKDDYGQMLGGLMSLGLKEEDNDATAKDEAMMIRPAAEETTHGQQLAVVTAPEFNSTPIIIRSGEPQQLVDDDASSFSPESSSPTMMMIPASVDCNHASYADIQPLQLVVAAKAQDHAGEAGTMQLAAMIMMEIDQPQQPNQLDNKNTKNESHNKTAFVPPPLDSSGKILWGGAASNAVLLNRLRVNLIRLFHKARVDDDELLYDMPAQLEARVSHAVNLAPDLFIVRHRAMVLNELADRAATASRQFSSQELDAFQAEFEQRIAVVEQRSKSRSRPIVVDLEADDE